MKCFVKTCVNKKPRKNSVKQFFFLPNGTSRRQEWIKAAGQEPETISERYPASRWVCEDHFEVRIYAIACMSVLTNVCCFCFMRSLNISI